MAALVLAGQLVQLKKDLGGAAQADDALDAVIVIYVPPTSDEAADVARAIRELAATATKPVLACFMADEAVSGLVAPGPRSGDEADDGHAVPVYQHGKAAGRGRG